MKDIALSKKSLKELRGELYSDKTLPFWKENEDNPVIVPYKTNQTRQSEEQYEALKQQEDEITM